MNKANANKWMVNLKNTMTVKQALDLMQKTSVKGKSKSSPTMSKEKVISSLQHAIEIIGKEKGLDYNLCENTSANRLIVKHVVMECMS